MSLTTRTLLCAALLGVVAVPAQAADKKRDAAMLELAERHRCLNCHEVDVKVRGPAWREVGRRSRADPEAEARRLVTVREGGSGVWGDAFMSPNTRVSDADLQALVRWILSLR